MLLGTTTALLALCEAQGHTRCSHAINAGAHWIDHCWYKIPRRSHTPVLVGVCMAAAAGLDCEDSSNDSICQCRVRQLNTRQPEGSTGWHAWRCTYMCLTQTKTLHPAYQPSPCTHNATPCRCSCCCCCCSYCFLQLLFKPTGFNQQTNPVLLLQKPLPQDCRISRHAKLSLLRP
jgi:hypothetical protein